MNKLKFTKVCLDNKPICDILGAIDDSYAELIDFQKVVDKKCELEFQTIDEYQDRFIKIAKEDELDKEAVFALINDLLKLCRRINLSERQNCRFVCDETGSAYGVLKTILDLFGIGEANVKE